MRRLLQGTLILGLLCFGVSGCAAPSYGYYDYPGYGYAPYSYGWPIYTRGYDPHFNDHHDWEDHHNNNGHHQTFWHGSLGAGSHFSGGHAGGFGGGGHMGGFGGGHGGGGHR